MPDFSNSDFDDGIATLQEGLRWHEYLQFLNRFTNHMFFAAMFPLFEAPESWNYDSDMGHLTALHHSGNRIMNTDFDISNSIR